MPKVKYHFNTHSLKYERVIVGWKKRSLRWLGWLASAVVFGALIMVFAYNVFDSPKEKRLKRELEESTFQLQLLTRRTDQVTAVLKDIQERDNTIYRVIFEAEPISESVREAGFGGMDKYRVLRDYYNPDLLIDITKRVDKLSKQLYVQSKSFDEVWSLVKNKSQMLASIPAIQPVANKDLKHVASGFGWRIHPIYKTEMLHTGMDFTASVGTEIHATGNGVVNKVEMNGRGYGNNVTIDHGYGYETLYGHMSKIAVRQGQKISRGDLVGFVGNTGNARTIAPHLHFGIYGFTDGATDPLPFIRLGRGPARQSLLSHARLGDSARVSSTRTVVRLAPHSDAAILRELPKSSALIIIGGTEAWLRVELPDGLTGYTAGNMTEAEKRPLRRLVLPIAKPLLDAADSRAAAIKLLPIGSAVDVLAVDHSFQLVRNADGQTGWLSAIGTGAP